MTVGRTARLLSVAKLALLMLVCDAASRGASAATPRQQSLDEWRSLTAPAAPAPRAFVKGDHIRFFFQSETNLTVFGGSWKRLRVPAKDYKINSAVLRLEPNLPASAEDRRGWREAVVVEEDEWRELTTNLVSSLTPETPGHGVYYQGFVANRFWYRDEQGIPRFTAMGEQPKGIVIDGHFSVDETLDNLAATV